MTSLPRVTIITPFLNAEANLGEAIASVRSQTVTDWELVLVDDGSTDDSVKIANDVAATDPRIKVLRRPPGSKRGAAAARNAGIEAGSGDLLAFLDADDLYEDQALWAKLFLRFTVFVTPVTLARYRQHPGSASASATERGLYDRMGKHPARAAFLDWIAEHMAESGRQDFRVQWALRLAR